MADIPLKFGSKSQMLDMDAITKSIENTVLSQFQKLTSDLQSELKLELQVPSEITLEKKALNKEINRIKKEIDNALKSVGTEVFEKGLEDRWTFNHTGKYGTDKKDRPIKLKDYDKMVNIRDYKNQRLAMIHQLADITDEGIKIKDSKNLHQLIQNIKAYEEALSRLHELSAQKGQKYKPDEGELNFEKLFDGYKLAGDAKANAEAIAKSFTSTYINTLQSELEHKSADLAEVMRKIHRQVYRSAGEQEGVGYEYDKEEYSNAVRERQDAELHRDRNEAEIENRIRDEINAYIELENKLSDLFDQAGLDLSSDKLQELEEKADASISKLRQAIKYLDEYKIDLDALHNSYDFIQDGQESLRDYILNGYEQRTEISTNPQEGYLGTLVRETNKSIEAVAQAQKNEDKARQFLDYWKNLLLGLKDTEQMQEVVSDLSAEQIQSSLQELTNKNTELQRRIEELEKEVADYKSVDNSNEQYQTLTVSNIGNELESLGDLEEKLEDVTDAISAKTAAFEDEHTKVTSWLSDETRAAQELNNALTKVSEGTSGINIGLGASPKGDLSGKSNPPTEIGNKHQDDIPPKNPPDFTEFNNALKSSASLINELGSAAKIASDNISNANGLRSNSAAQAKKDAGMSVAESYDYLANNILDYRSLRAKYESGKITTDAQLKRYLDMQKQIQAATSVITQNITTTDQEAIKARERYNQALAQANQLREKELSSAKQVQAVEQKRVQIQQPQKKETPVSNPTADAYNYLSKNIKHFKLLQDDYKNGSLTSGSQELKEYLELEEKINKANNQIFTDRMSNDPIVLAAQEKYNQALNAANVALQKQHELQSKNAGNKRAAEQKQQSDIDSKNESKLINAIQRAKKLRSEIQKIEATRDTKGISDVKGAELPDLKRQLNDLLTFISETQKIVPASEAVRKAFNEMARSAETDATTYNAAVKEFNDDEIIKTIEKLKNAQSEYQKLTAIAETTGLTDTQRRKLDQKSDEIDKLKAKLGNLDKAAEQSDRVREAVDQMAESGKRDIEQYNKSLEEFNKQFQFVQKLEYTNGESVKEYFDQYVKGIGGKDLRNFQQRGYKRGNEAFTAEFTAADGQVKKLNASLNQTSQTLRGVVSEGKSAGNFFTDLTEAISNKWTNFLAYLSSGAAVYKLWGVLKQGIYIVRELDSAFVELKRISHDSASALDEFRKSSFDIANDVGSTASTIINAAAEWEHLGYSVKEAGELAKTSAVYKNIADGMTSDSEATEDLVSILKAYKFEAKDAMDVTDALIATSNNYAVTAADIGNILKRSSAALAMGGNSFEQTVAMGTAMSEVLQSAEVAGSSLKVLALRLRSSKTELAEMGEETDNLVESTPKLQGKIKALTKGFDILSSDGKTIKNTYEIMKGIANVWQDMSDVDQAALLELIAGKTRAQGVSALLSNWDQVDKVLRTIAEDEGTALRNNEEKLNTINGRITQLTNASQRLAQDAFNTEFIKDFISVGTDAVNLLDQIINKIGTIPTIAGVIGTISTFTKGGGQPNSGLVTYKATDIVRGNTKQVFHMF